MSECTWLDEMYSLLPPELYKHILPPTEPDNEPQENDSE